MISPAPVLLIVPAVWLIPVFAVRVIEPGAVILPGIKSLLIQLTIIFPPREVKPFVKFIWPALPVEDKNMSFPAVTVPNAIFWLTLFILTEPFVKSLAAAVTRPPEVISN